MKAIFPFLRFPCSVQALHYGTSDLPKLCLSRYNFDVMRGGQLVSPPPMQCTETTYKKKKKKNKISVKGIEHQKLETVNKKKKKMIVH